MKFIGTATQIQVILEGLLALYGSNAKIVEVIRRRVSK